MGFDLILIRCLLEVDNLSTFMNFPRRQVFGVIILSGKILDNSLSISEDYL